MNFYVYVIGTRQKPKRTYVGWTNNIKKRLLMHNLGKGAKFTRGRKWKIIFLRKFASKKEAMSKEYYFKKDRKFRRSLLAKF